MHRAFVIAGTVAFLSSLPAAGFAQSTPIGSSADLKGLQERSIQTFESNVAPESPTGVVSGSPRINENRLQIDRNVEILIRPERSNPPSGVYPVDDTSSGNQVQVLYQLE
ncbi:MAG: hypothetical protein K6T90_13965 [Leptolyngbyaceae cyanobacterium HOT.MB2.61]|nr:hypothetical protein [Leptolyngbyaceae cyanobacterium HOT.MB2.61]